MNAAAVAIGAPLAITIATLLALAGTGYVTLSKRYAQSLGVIGGLKR